MPIVINWQLIILNGLVDSVNPCAIGVLLMYLTLMFTWGRSRSRIVYFSLFYILAVYITYLLIGLSILKTVHLFGIRHLFVYAAGALSIFFGLFSLKSHFYPQLRIPVLTPLIEACRVPKLSENFTILGALGLGAAVAVCEFPCSGAIYLATIGLLSVQETFFQGLIYLLIYNLMFILPLAIIFALSANKNFVAKMKNWQGKKHGVFKIVSGIFMIALGIGIIIWTM